MSTKSYFLSICVSIVFLQFLSVQAATSVKIINLDAYDLVYDSFSQRIYASVSSTDLNHSNSIAIINPVTGTVENSIFAGSDPRKLAISSDGQYIYIGLQGAGKVCRFNVSSKTVDQDFSLGTGSYGTTYAEDIAVQPGNPNVIAVSRYRKGVSPRHDGVAIYDHGIKRPQQTPDHTGANRIEFSDSPEVIYGYNNETTEFGVRTLIVNEYGVSTANTKGSLISGFGVDIEYDDGYLYSTNGRIVDTQTMQLAGQFGASGKIEPDSTVRRTFFVNGSTIYAYNQKSFAKEGQYTVSGASGSPRNLIRWGRNGLAYSTSGKEVVLLQTDLVPDPPVLISLVIDGPIHLSSYKGQYKLLATFDDGVVLDVTKKARWYTDPNTYTSIDNTATLYVFGTEEPGTTTIKANYIWAGTLHEATKEISYEGTIPATGNLIRLEIDGPDQVLLQSSVQYTATAFFDDNTQYDVTNEAIWSLSNTEFARINEAGLLTIDEITRSRDLVIHAFFGYKDAELETNKTIIVLEDPSQMSTSDWPTYQGNPQHTGYVPVSLDPQHFSLRWTKSMSGLKPVSASAGRVFAATNSSLNCLDARDGETLWSQSTSCHHQATYAYGYVYVQTDQHSPGYIRAFDAGTGQQIFASTFSQQWDTWWAPVVYDGSIYIAGGYYGGINGYNAFDGTKQWFLSLNQYDQWTPATQGKYVYAYLGDSCSGCNNAGLSIIDRKYGTRAAFIRDSRFDWHGWSMNLAPVIGSLNDVLVIQDGRLLSFDVQNKTIGWEIPGGFSGMPSVAEGVIYVVRNGMLEARDEATGNLIWDWTPPEGSLKSPMIVTQTHVIACTSTNTYTIELLSRESDWSYQASGCLSLGNDTLYIAGGEVLTALATPEYIPATPVKLEIEGPDVVFENSTNAYQATVYYSDGRIRNRTALCNWTLTGPPLAAIGQGSLSVGELLYPQETVILTVEYTEKDVTVADEKEIIINIGCTVKELITRNLEGALQSKQQILLELEQALARERATRTITKELFESKSENIAVPDGNEVDSLMARAIILEKLSRMFVNRSVDDLVTILEMFSKDSLYLQNTDEYRELLSLTFNEQIQIADVNGDGIVNMLDIAEISKFWLERY